MHADVSPARGHTLYLSYSPPTLAATATGGAEIPPAAVPGPAMPFTKVLPTLERYRGRHPGWIILSGRTRRSNSSAETWPRRIASSRSVVHLAWAAFAIAAARSYPILGASAVTSISEFFNRSRSE